VWLRARARVCALSCVCVCVCVYTRKRAPEPKPEPERGCIAPSSRQMCVHPPASAHECVPDLHLLVERARMGACVRMGLWVHVWAGVCSRALVYVRELRRVV